MEQHEDYFHNDRAQASRWVIDDGESQEQIQRMVVSMFLLTYSKCIVFWWRKPRNSLLLVPHIRE
jgi:hypothetical protein